MRARSRVRSSSENLGGCVAGCESDSIRAAVECVCARVHDAVRRANPNQFVMTLFSSRASLARRRVRCETRFRSALFVFARVFTSGYWIFRGNARESDAVIYCCCTQSARSLPSICMICHQPARPYWQAYLFSICMARTQRGAKSARTREQQWMGTTIGKKEHLEPEFSFCVCHWRNKIWRFFKHGGKFFTGSILTFD